MMKTTLMKTICSSVIFLQLIFPTHCFAEENNLSSAFNTYQKNYQAEDFAAAKTSIEDALKTNTHNSYLIYNLGLTEYKLGKPGLAIGLWRKALSINPRFNEPRQAINYAVSHMQSKPLTQNTDSTWAWIEKLITERLSFNYLWPAFLVCFFIFGVQFIRYLSEKKKAFAEDLPSPLLGTKPILFLVLAIVLGFVSFFSYSNLISTKATIIEKTSDVKTGPNTENATLFELPEGTEVLIRDKENGWYKIEDPTGRIGWTEGTQLFVTSNI
jgi:tetratricopeptide (TPR) repeat protein